MTTFWTVAWIAFWWTAASASIVTLVRAMREQW